MYLALALSWLIITACVSLMYYISCLIGLHGGVLLVEPSRAVQVAELAGEAIALWLSIYIIVVCVWRFIKERREKRHDSGKTTAS